MTKTQKTQQKLNGQKMKINIKCLFGHKWTKWNHIGVSGRYFDKLSRTCEKCKKTDIYIGLTEKDILDGSLSPYFFKD